MSACHDCGQNDCECNSPETDRQLAGILALARIEEDAEARGRAARRAEATDDLDALLAERLKDPTFADAYVRAGVIAEARAEGYRLGRAEAIADLRARADGSDGLLIGYMSAAAYLEAKGHQP